MPIEIVTSARSWVEIVRDRFEGSSLNRMALLCLRIKSGHLRKVAALKKESRVNLATTTTGSESESKQAKKRS